MFQLYYDFDQAFIKGQYWRLLTTFLYFGPFSLSWFFQMYFMAQYMRDLEEGSFRNRSADFLWFLLYAIACLLVCSSFATMPFLAPALSFVIIYLWSRRNPGVTLNLLGLFTFRAPYFPLVMIGLSYLFSGGFPVQSIVGLLVGHVYYFLEDVWPLNPASHQRRYLQPPHAFARLVGALGIGRPQPAPVEVALDDPEPLVPPPAEAPRAASPPPAAATDSPLRPRTGYADASSAEE
ncbi:hypothetical protein H4R34_003877 [Dimargaris verticillata]|uniref:Derlin n=1 Tax=Dimargaris verticillata TaxID=2761393 RepID=A0A9W8B008_9FUNG|nr:hypothetical protein H4R34_003877 [Dimargaris verticillata]